MVVKRAWRALTDEQKLASGYVDSDGIPEQYEGIPNVQAHTVTVSPGVRQLVRQLVIKCPHCGKEHQHGGGYVGEPLHQSMGHRCSHCLKNKNPGYTIGIPRDAKWVAPK